MKYYRFILIGCDGVWKVFTAEDAASFVVKVLEVRNYYKYISSCYSLCNAYTHMYS